MDAKESEFDRIVRTRRSVRKFRGDAPPAELVDAVVRAGLLAPTGRKRQSSVIVRIDDEELRGEIVRKNAEILGNPPAGRGPDPFYGAPVMLLVIADASCETAVYDGSLALGNMMLKAHELGLASCWIHRAKEEMESPLGAKILSRLGLEGRYIGVGHLALGYADGPEPPAYEIRADRYRVI
jgi:hypothetical protein